jgi:hypothetical protein
MFSLLYIRYLLHPQQRTGTFASTLLIPPTYHKVIMVVHHFLLQARSQPVHLVGGWLLMLIYSERKVLLAGG